MPVSPSPTSSAGAPGGAISPSSCSTCCSISSTPKARWQLCWALGVSDHELAALSAMKGYAGPRPSGYGPRGPSAQPPAIDPYAVLGIERTANERDIKRAYRKLMSQHHPDKLGDVPDELKRRAEDRAREINTAYERIKSERRIR
jgi:DnaJ like chaperone protein